MPELGYLVAATCLLFDMASISLYLSPCSDCYLCRFMPCFFTFQHIRFRYKRFPLMLMIAYLI